VRLYRINKLGGLLVGIRLCSTAIVPAICPCRVIHASPSSPLYRARLSEPGCVPPCAGSRATCRHSVGSTSLCAPWPRAASLRISASPPPKSYSAAFRRTPAVDVTESAVADARVMIAIPISSSRGVPSRERGDCLVCRACRAERQRGRNLDSRSIWRRTGSIPQRSTQIRIGNARLAATREAPREHQRPEKERSVSRF
jgi:hypothetical protein